MIKHSCLLFLCCLVNLANSNAQSTTPLQTASQKPFVLGTIVEFQSAALHENRLLNIYLPEGYSPDSVKTYPVIYLLDGSANEDFIHIVGIVQFLSMIEVMPKSIVVGIGNVDRRRDFTFPTTIAQDKKDYPTTGGSALFTKFLENELLPFIDRNYKTNTVKTIIGQSLGGLLATEILLNKHGFFNNYIIVSPSLWWDNESLLARGLKMNTGNPVQVYISVGNEGKKMEDDAKHLTAMLQASREGISQITLLPLPDENHLTILHNSVYKGLKILFAK